MRIQWLGHSAFLLEESTGTKVVTDPFSKSVVGYSMPATEADIVTMSHSHGDHSCMDGIITDNPQVLNKAGAYEIKGVHIMSMQSFHDASKGRERGENLIFKFRIDGVEICHLGDIGEECNIMLSEMIGSVNVLLIPVGGNYTIDAVQAKEYVDLLMPDVVIPMHYRTPDCDIDIDKVDAFIKLFDDEQIVYAAGNSMEFDRVRFDDDATKVIVFE